MGGTIGADPRAMKTRNPLAPIWRGVLRYTLYFLSVRVAITAIALVGDGAMQMLGNNCLITVARHQPAEREITPMYRWQMNRWYREPERWTPWTAGLVGGALGMMVVGALWYVQSQTRPPRQGSERRSLPQHGQAPSRSHIQLASHPARQA